MRNQLSLLSSFFKPVAAYGTVFAVGLACVHHASGTDCVTPPSGLASWWAAEGNANDTADGNHGVFHNGTYALGMVGQAFAFNGTTSYASFAASSNLNVGLGPGLTFDCWIRPTDLSSAHVLAEWNDGAGKVGAGLWISIAELGGLGSVFANIVDTNGVDHYFATAANVLILNSFQHVALTYDQSTGVARLFLNGVVVASQNLGVFTPQTSYAFELGRRSSGTGTGHYYAGQMDEVSLYSRQLSIAEIQSIFTAGNAGKCQPPPQCVPAPSDLVSWWRAEGNTDDTVDGNAGTLVGGATFAAGKVGQAFSLNGTSGYIRVPASPSLNVGLSNGLTIECWVRPSDLANMQPLVEWNSGTSLGVQLWISLPYFGGQGGPGDVFANVTDTSGVTHALVSAPGLLTTNSFQHVAVTYAKASGMGYLYLNGVVVFSANLGDFTPQTSYDLYLGRRPSNDYPGYYGGLLDEVSLYGRALSAAEILAIYAAGTAGKCSGPIPPFIASQPTNQTVIQGETATFAVVAGGTPPLSYQWFFDSTPVEGATNSSLVLTNLQFSQAGNYTVQVTNTLGSATSSVAVLTVNSPPPCAAPPSDLVSWWRGEGSGADALGGNDGVLQGGMTFGAGKVSQAFLFNGTDASVAVGSRPNLDVGAGSGFTIETWIKPASVSEMMPVMEWNSGSGSEPHGVHLWTGVVGAGSLFANLVDTSGVYHGVQTGSGLLTANAFQHVAVSYDKTTGKGKLYLNGQVVAQENLGTFTPQTRYDCYVGFRPAGSPVARYAGAMDEISLYARVLSDAEIQAIYTAGGAGKCATPTGPFIFSHPTNRTVMAGETASFSVVAGGTPPLSYQWKFKETAIEGATNSSLTLLGVQLAQAGNYSVEVTNLYGSTVSSNALLTVNPPPPCATPPAGLLAWWRGEGNPWDQLGTNHGTVVGDTTYGTGRAGQAFAFDGKSDAVQVGNNVTLQVQNLTIETWIKRASSSAVSYGSGGNGVIFGYGTGGYGLYVSSSGRLNFTKMGSTAVSLSSPRVTDTGLHHVAVTKSGSNIVFYVDGVAYPGATFAPSFTFSTVAAIGARGDNLDNSFYGAVDELAVYGRALDAAEIAAIHAAGLSGKCLLTVPPFIATQPTNQTVVVGSNVTFSISAVGTMPLSYEWRFGSAPIEGATNATLNLANVQFSQAGSYVAVVINAAGAVTSSPAVLMVTNPPAVIAAVSTNATSASTVTVPVVLVANGNENALGFSLNFNPAHLTYVEVTLGSGAPGGSLLYNTSQIAEGRLGVAVALASDATFNAGTQEVARVFFTTAILAEPTASSLAFGNQPVMRQLSDVLGNVLPAEYLPATVTIAAVDYEGDVSPRPDGNKTVSITDWVLAGRYVARLDYPTNSGEFQRADCAPRATLGDGQIKVTDWVQAGRYAAVLDPLTPIGGPATESPGGAPRYADGPQPGPDPSPRQLQAADMVLAEGQAGTLKVRLEAQGDEAALGFSLAFDPEALSYVGATQGSGAAGASLYVNALQATAGRLGVALALPAGNTFTAGSKEIVQVTLRAAAGTTGSVAVTFTDLPVPREVSDVLANPLSAAYVTSNVVIHPPPALRIGRVDQELTLAWPLWATNFTLQVAEGSLPLSSTWTNLPVTPSQIGGECVVTLPMSDAAKFYRLRQP